MNKQTILLVLVSLLMISGAMAAEKSVKSYVNYTVDCHTVDQETRVKIIITPREAERKLTIFDQTFPEFLCDDTLGTISYRFDEEFEVENGSVVEQCKIYGNISKIQKNTEGILDKFNTITSSESQCWKRVENITTLYTKSKVALDTNNTRLSNLQKDCEEYRTQTGDYEDVTKQLNQCNQQKSTVSTDAENFKKERLTYGIIGALIGAAALYFYLNRSKSPQQKINQEYPSMRR